jgi:hypothetical protein
MKTYITILLAFLAVQIQASELSGILQEIQDVVTLSDRVRALEERPTVEPVSNPYEFVLKDDDGDGFIDDEWEEIIQKGQAQQAKVWAEKEKYWKERNGTPPAGEAGWYGSSTMPVIRIICAGGEHFAHGSLRLPGRFELTSPARWGAMIRFEGDDHGKSLVDDIAYGVRTDAKIGIYVEPKTIVETENGTMIVKPFEQTIERVVLVAMNGVLPVYLAQNQDRFLMQECNVQQHQGAQIGIKHGPPLQGRSYPFAATQLLDGHTYLADPRFLNIQAEGPHNDKPRQVFLFASGNNIIADGFTVYGWRQTVYFHGGQNRIVSNITIHHGQTADGRQWTAPDKIVSYILSTRPGNTPDAVSGIAGGFNGWILPKGSQVPSGGGWHNAGEWTL